MNKHKRRAVMNIKNVGKGTDGVRTLQVVGGGRATPGHDEGLRIILPHDGGFVEILEQVRSGMRILDVSVCDGAASRLYNESWIIGTFDVAQRHVGAGAVAVGTKGRTILEIVAQLGGEAQFNTIFARIDFWLDESNAKRRQQRVQGLLRHIFKGGYIKRPTAWGSPYCLTPKGWAIVDDGLRADRGSTGVLLLMAARHAIKTRLDMDAFAWAEACVNLPLGQDPVRAEVVGQEVARSLTFEHRPFHSLGYAHEMERGVLALLPAMRPQGRAIVEGLLRGCPPRNEEP